MNDRQAERDKVDRLRYLADRLAGDEWLIDMDDSGQHLLSNRSHEGMVIVASFHKDALPHEVELVSMGLDVARLLLSVGDKAGRIIAALRKELGRIEKKQAEKDYATNASMAIKDRTFWRFLEATTTGGPVRTETAADTRIKSILNFKSKNDLNDDPEAGQRWASLMRNFKNWKG